MQTEEYLDVFLEEDHSQLQEMAQPQTLEDVIAFWNSTTDEPIEATNSIAKKVDKLKAIKQAIESLREIEKSLKDDIAVYMKDKAMLVNEDGEILVTFKHSKPTKKFNEKLFKYDNKELYEQYIEEKEAVRRFLIK